MKVHLKALGCRLNEAELEQWSQQFQADGYQLSQQADDAELLVLNTCAVTHEASRKSRQLINRLHRDNPTAKLIVTGCHSSLNAEQVADTLGVDLVIRNDQKSQLPQIVRRELSLPTMPLSATEPDDIALYSRGRHRAFIKIQDGCRYRCTFCIVTIARGSERSRALAEIIQEIRNFHDHGIQEVVLTGVHVGGYGSDNGSNLFSLITAILQDTDIPRLRLASVEPWDLPEHFFSLFDNPRLMPHMHLPLQSGSDKILRRMARRCKTLEFKALAEQARSAHPGFNITTDIIAGFPGETEQDWQTSLEFIDSIGFGHLHIFPYSPRLGTKAAGLPGQVDKATKQRRCKELAQLGETMKKRAMHAFLDSSHPILWEKPSLADGHGMIRYSGYTPHFHRVETRVPSDQPLEYKITTTQLTHIDTAKLLLHGSINKA